jgi:hypothetical protein
VASVPAVVRVMAEDAANAPVVKVVPEDAANAPVVKVVPEDAANAPVVKVVPEDAANAPVVKVVPEDAVNAPAPVRVQEARVRVDLVRVGARARGVANAPAPVNARDEENARGRKPSRLHPHLQHLQHPNNEPGIANPIRLLRISRQGASRPAESGH